LIPLTTTGLQVEIGPFLARIRSELPGVRDHLTRFYPDFPMRPSQGGHFDVAIVGGQGIRRFVRRQASLVVNGSRPFLPLPVNLAGPVLEWGLNWCIGTKSHHLVVAHAAVVERGGKTLILPARSGSGKSTLGAALVYSGWRLFSDEFALIDPVSGLLSPAPRPIALKGAAIEVIRKRHPEVVYGPEGQDTDGARFVHARPPSESVRRARERASPGWIVFPRYVAGSVTKLEPMTKARALMEVAGQSFNFNYLVNGFNCLTELVRRTDSFSLEYSSLDDVLDKLTRLTAI
jgi:HprK-related kinase A